MYSEELMTVSVGTDYTKPDPRERGGERERELTGKRNNERNQRIPHQDQRRRGSDDLFRSLRNS